MTFIDSFGFYRSSTKSLCTSSDVVEFIENIIEHSKSGQFMFFIRSNLPGMYSIKGIWIIDTRKSVLMVWFIFIKDVTSISIEII